MRKLLFSLITAFMILAVSGCANHFEGVTDSNEAIYKTTKTVYLFDTKEELRASLKYIVNKESGQIPLNNNMEKKLDEAEIVFDKEKYEGRSNFNYYPDFTQIDHNIVAYESSEFHQTGGGGYVVQGYYTCAVKIYFYDEAQNIVSEPIYIDSGCSY